MGMKEGKKGIGFLWGDVWLMNVCVEILLLERIGFLYDLWRWCLCWNMLVEILSSQPQQTWVVDPHSFKINGRPKPFVPGNTGKNPVKIRDAPIAYISCLSSTWYLHCWDIIRAIDKWNAIWVIEMAKESQLENSLNWNIKKKFTVNQEQVEIWARRVQETRLEFCQQLASCVSCLVEENRLLMSSILPEIFF